MGRERLHNYRRAFPCFSKEVTLITSTHISMARTSHMTLPNVKCSCPCWHKGEKTNIFMPIVKSSTVMLGNLLSLSEPSFLVKRRVMNVPVPLGCVKGDAWDMYCIMPDTG